MFSFLSGLDGNILLFIQDNIRMDFLNPVVEFVTKLGNAGFIWILISLFLICFKNTRHIGIMGVVALLLSFLINNMILKNLVARTRPYDVISNLMPIISKPHEFSFPSGHAASSFAAAWVFFRKLPKKYGVTLLILAVLIALSRLYVGVHYPSDVIFGAIDGILISCLAMFIVDKICTKIKKPEVKN